MKRLHDLPQPVIHRDIKPANLLMMLSVVFGCFNYRNIQAIFPFCKSENRLTRYTGITLLILTMFALLTLIMNILRDIF